MRPLRSSRLTSWTFACLLLSASCAPETSTTDDDTSEEDDDTQADDDSAKDDPKDAGSDSGRRDASKPPVDDSSAPSEDDDDVGGDDDGDDEMDDGGTPMEGDAGTMSNDEDDAGLIDDMDSLLPYKEGYSWTYRVSGGTGMVTKVTTVGPLETVGGTGPNKDKMAYKVTTMKGADKTVSWQAVVGSSVLRYREIAYSAMTGMPELEEHWAPHKLHIHSGQEYRKAGHKWVETYMETKAMAGMSPMSASAADNWSVDGVDVSVTVPAGTFKAIVFVKASPSGQKTYWYVPGVGKVKETGGQTEELTEFDVE